MLFLASVKDFDFFAKMKIQLKRGMVHLLRQSGFYDEAPKDKLIMIRFSGDDSDKTMTVLHLFSYYFLGLPKLNFLAIAGFCSFATMSSFSLVREESEHQSGRDGSRM